MQPNRNTRGGRMLLFFSSTPSWLVGYKTAQVVSLVGEILYFPSRRVVSSREAEEDLSLSNQQHQETSSPQVTSWFSSAFSNTTTTCQLTKPSPQKAFKMMQISSDSASNKHSLINVMHRFIAAANNMDETIMVPSLLRDVPLEERAAGDVEPNNNSSNNRHDDDEDNHETPCPNKQRDMYEHYLLLKSIKNDMEWGLLKREMSGGASFLEMAVKQEEVSGEELHPDDNSDLENQFHYHLRGLFGVLSKLTLQADHLTNRYKREIGGGNFMR